MSGKPAVSRISIFAHRGGGDGTENSVAAIEASAGAGADGVEIDVRVLPDGDIVATHDPLTHGEDTRGLAGLDTVLATVARTELTLLLDVKSDGSPEREASALHAALAAHSGDRLLVSSFSLPVLRALRDLRPSLQLIPIISLRQNLFDDLDPDDWAGTSVLAAALLNPVLLRRIKRSSRPLYVWFGATEWNLALRLTKRIGAHAVIVGDIVGARRALT